MSQPFSRYLHPFDPGGHPSHEPEVRRAIFSSLARGGQGPLGRLFGSHRSPAPPARRQ